VPKASDEGNLAPPALSAVKGHAAVHKAPPAAGARRAAGPRRLFAAKDRCSASPSRPRYGEDIPSKKSPKGIAGARSWLKLRRGRLRRITLFEGTGTS